jgi:mono/diheme cytochrome c family protein
LIPSAFGVASCLITDLKINTMKPAFFIFLVSVFCLTQCTSVKQEANSTAIPTEKSLVAFVDLTDPLEEVLVSQGADIFSSKCATCHTIDTVEFSVPAFAGITNRRSPKWIMNMIINVDEMLKQDPVAADLLRRHKKVMPDPELSVDQARAMLEFLRNNDLEQVGQKDLAASE